jgi:3-hydroxyacyl-CoA dehydrogenase/3a,7a,12a-trihydroxy-5b-cholest-24-enoyl-CoA hydratase
MTETVLPKEVLENIQPEYVAPLVAFLCHDSCEETGSLFEVGAGYVAKLRWQRTAGHLFPLKEFTVENIKSKWDKITDFEKNPTYPASNLELMEIISQNFGSGKTADGGSKADEIFGMMYTYLSQGNGKDIVPKVNAIFAFEITKTKGFNMRQLFGLIQSIKNMFIEIKLYKYNKDTQKILSKTGK